MATKYFPQNANADTTCDTSAKPQDLSQTQGTPATSKSDAIASESYVEVHTFDIDVSADSPITGNHTISVDVSVMSTACTARFRIQAVDDSGCAVSASSAYSAEFNSGSSFPIVLSATNLTWGAGNERLRLSVELKRDAGGCGNKSVTFAVQDAGTFVEAPWGGLVPGPDIRPDEDVSNAGTWTEVGAGTTLWEAIDEVSPDESATYITVAAVGDSECEVGLEGVADPVSSADHVIHIRGKMQSGTGTIKVELIENTTVRATLAATALATSYGDHTYTLSAGEANSITDYADLRLRITHNSVGNECRITQAYFSAPTAGGPAPRRIFIT